MIVICIKMKASINMYILTLCIYLLCIYILCKMQYVGKAETAFNLRLNNHRKDTEKPNSILTCKHFQEQGYNFKKHAKFIIIDKLVNLYGSKEVLRVMLVTRENFWIQKFHSFIHLSRT